MSEAGFRKLEGKIQREYREKGYSEKKASYIAHAAAGKVAREHKHILLTKVRHEARVAAKKC